MGAYPLSPPLDIRVSGPPPDQTPEYDIELTLVDVTNGGGQLPANIAGTGPPDDNRVVFLATTLPSAPASATLQYRFDYGPPAAGKAPPTTPPPSFSGTSATTTSR